ncbi:MAG: GTPase [Arachnia sp.]
MSRPLPERLQALYHLVEHTRGKVPAELTERAERVGARATQRLQVGEQTVVALAGATGSGKSSLFNAIAKQSLAEQSARRPTTADTLAVSFGPTNAKLLDWLQVKRRYEVPPSDPRLENLILLDLPDHDSTEKAHRDEVDRMVRVVDQFVWVLDPQKYADAAVHDRYLRPLAEHRDVITVVLNQADRLPPAQLAACLRDLRLLLDSDGLPGVPLLSTSALTRQGVDDLRSLLGELAQRKSAAAARLNADLDVLGVELEAAIGEGSPASPDKAIVATLNDSLAVAAGVPLVTEAVYDSMVQRGTLAAGWPLVKWIAGLKPDPLKRLRIGGSRKPELTSEVPERSSLPRRSEVADARLRTALRQLAAQLGEGMPPPWQKAVSQAVQSNVTTLPDALDQAIVTADLATDRTPAWWQLLRVLQWLLIAAVVIGAVWLGLNAVFVFFGLPGLPLVPIGPAGGLQVPLPTLLAGGGLDGVEVRSVGARVLVGLGARSAERHARAVLHSRVAEVAQRDVLQPAQSQLNRYGEVRALVAKVR